MEMEKAGNLGLAAPDRGSDLRLGLPGRSRLPHRTDQLGTPPGYKVIGTACNLRQTAGHVNIIATVIQAHRPLAEAAALPAWGGRDRYWRIRQVL